jgi:hypothetical protein
MTRATCSHIGAELNAVGNHQLDKGRAELPQNGGCKQMKGAADGAAPGLAGFPSAGHLLDPIGTTKVSFPVDRPVQ